MSATQRTLSFLALLLAVLALAPALAHLLELPSKLTLGREDYFVVQGIYRGWSLLGIVVIGALLASLALALALRDLRPAFAWALAAFLCIAATQAIFWSFTFPTNAATDDWTTIPAEWERLRLQWEWSHAAGAVLNLSAVVCLMLALLSRVPRVK